MLSLTVRAEGWENPWDKGTGFDDPFKSNISKSKPDEPVKTQPVQKPQSVPPSAKSYPAEKAGGMKSMDTLIEDDKTYENYSMPEYLTPLGFEKGGDMGKARAKILASGFVSGGLCGKGEVFFREPENQCAGIVLMGEKTITGASTFISRNCLKDDPTYEFLADFARKGQEYTEGWEISKGNAQGAKNCMRTLPVLSGGTPKFLGVITETMSKDMVEMILKEMGATLIKRFDNGNQYRLEDSIINHEFCIPTGSLVAMSVIVGKNSPTVRKLVDKMNIRTNRREYENLSIFSEQSPSGEIQKTQFVYTKNEKKCLKLS